MTFIVGHLSGELFMGMNHRPRGEDVAASEDFGRARWDESTLSDAFAFNLFG
jgi:hypothetical protein